MAIAVTVITLVIMSVFPGISLCSKNTWHQKRHCFIALCNSVWMKWKNKTQNLLTLWWGLEQSENKQNTDENAVAVATAHMIIRQPRPTMKPPSWNYIGNNS